jgi:hypothetical protein
MTVSQMGGNFPNRTGDNTEKHQPDVTFESFELNFYSE